MSLDISDLTGGMTEVIVTSAQISEKDETKILVISSQINGEEIDQIGFFGDDVIDAALAKGRKEDDATFLQVPASKITKGQHRVVWINTPY